MTHLESAFSIDLWEPAEGDALAEPEGRGPATGRALIRKTYSGALQGTAVGEILTTQGEGGAAYLAQERVVGELDGRTRQLRAPARRRRRGRAGDAPVGVRRRRAPAPATSPA